MRNAFLKTLETGKKLGLLAFAGYIVCVVCGAVYYSLDSHGQIPHEQETLITASSDWMVGQSKECISVPIDPSWQDPKWARILDKLDSLREDDRRARLGGVSPQVRAGLYIVIQNMLQQSRHPAKISSTPVVNCDAGSERNISITFYRKMDVLNGQEPARWKCIRTDDSFKCYELTAGWYSITDEDLRQAIAQRSSTEESERQLREMEAQPGPPPSPSGYVFSVSAWQRANPKGDVAAAKAAAIAQHLTVVP